MRNGETKMFTLAKARAEIGNPARFARGSADVQENRVSSVTVEEQDGLLVYRGLVRGAAQQNHVSFAYHAEEDVFSQMSCACGMRPSATAEQSICTALSCPMISLKYTFVLYLNPANCRLWPYLYHAPDCR